MGLFDSLAGAVLSKAGGDKGAMVQVAMDLFNQHGGLEGVIKKFKASGLTEQVESWISQGENLSVSAEQILQVLGSQTIANIAARLSMDADDISSKIAEYLPQLIDKMTPNGKVDANANSVMSAILSMMK